MIANSAIRCVSYSAAACDEFENAHGNPLCSADDVKFAERNPDRRSRIRNVTERDLHCHSTYSDGVLPPGDVVRRAALHGVDVLALTDHDEVAGLAEARAAAADEGIELVAGAELSVTWEGHTLHVVAVQIDPNNDVLCEGLEAIRHGRDARAQKIANALLDAGISGAL